MIVLRLTDFIIITDIRHRSPSKAFKHDLTSKEREICDAIRDRLVEDGLFFVGIDVIGDKLVEVNCVSPGGIPRINRLNRVKLEAQVIDFIEKKVSEMKKKP